MTLDERTMRLIAVGASITANCQPCLDVNVAKAAENGVSPQDIAQAIAIGKMVRKGAASKMDQFASSLGTSSVSGAEAPNRDCGCS